MAYVTLTLVNFLSYGTPSIIWYQRPQYETRQTHLLYKLEKRYRRSGEAADRTIWSNFLREMHRGFKERECSYWEEKISEQSDNPKKLWKMISTVLGKKLTSKHSPAFSPDAYLSFLEEKVKKVYDDTSGAAHPTYTGCITSFGDLEVCPVEELERIIKSAPCKSCELDPVPTFLLLECLYILLPFIHIMCNSSLTSGVLPASQKKAIVIVTPRLKKVGMDENELGTFRPVFNLSFMSKIIEKIVARQFIRYLDEFDMWPKFQSGFRAFHSTETTLPRLLSDIHMAMDRGEVTLLVLLDVSAAFDSVEHEILVNRLRISFGITGRALDWLNSFIHGRTQSVVIGDRRSHWRHVRTGVPQGFLIGPPPVCTVYVRYTKDTCWIESGCPTIRWWHAGLRS